MTIEQVITPGPRCPDILPIGHQPPALCFVAQGRGQVLSDVAVYDRHAVKAARSTGSIGFSSVRAGSIVGDHNVMLASGEEIIELKHRAVDRAVFARGALRAAHWVAEQPPGHYSMNDVLGLDRP